MNFELKMMNAVIFTVRLQTIPAGDASGDASDDGVSGH